VVDCNVFFLVIYVRPPPDRNPSHATVAHDARA